MEIKTENEIINMRVIKLILGSLGIITLFILH